MGIHAPFADKADHDGQVLLGLWMDCGIKKSLAFPIEDLPTANLHIAASTTASALMRLEVGSAPSSPNDGDIWLESNTLTGLKIRISGVTRTITIS